MHLFSDVIAEMFISVLPSFQESASIAYLPYYTLGHMHITSLKTKIYCSIRHNIQAHQ